MSVNIELQKNIIKWHRSKTRLSFEDSVAYIKSVGGQMLTLEEARIYLRDEEVPCPGED